MVAERDKEERFCSYCWLSFVFDLNLPFADEFNETKRFLTLARVCFQQKVTILQSNV